MIRFSERVVKMLESLGHKSTIVPEAAAAQAQLVNPLEIMQRR
jgi:hypothetical protein